MSAKTFFSLLNSLLACTHETNLRRECATLSASIYWIKLSPSVSLCNDKVCVGARRRDDDEWSEKNERERKAITNNDEKFIVVIFPSISTSKTESERVHDTFSAKKDMTEIVKVLVKIFLMDIVYEKVCSFFLSFPFQRKFSFLVQRIAPLLLVQLWKSIRMLLRAISIENFSY